MKKNMKRAQKADDAEKKRQKTASPTFTPLHAQPQHAENALRK